MIPRLDPAHQKEGVPVTWSQLAVNCLLVLGWLAELEKMWKLTVAVLAVWAVSASAGPVPLIFWHGMGTFNAFFLVCPFTNFDDVGDSCCNPLSLGRLMDVVKKEVPGIYIQSMKFGSNILEDTLSGFFKNANDQIDIVCKRLTADSNLKSGFNVIGFSQGGQFW